MYDEYFQPVFIYYEDKKQFFVNYVYYFWLSQCTFEKVQKAETHHT